MKIQPTCIFSYRKGIKNNEFKCEFIYRRMFFDILPCIRLDKSPFFPSLHISFTFLNFHLLFAFSKEVGEDFEPKIKEYHPKKYVEELCTMAVLSVLSVCLCTHGQDLFKRVLLLNCLISL